LVEDQEQRLLTLNLRAAKFAPRYRRTERLVSTLRLNVARQSKVKVENVKISQKLNDYIWSSGGRRFIPKITVKIQKNEDGIVHTRLPNEMEVPEKEKERPQEAIEAQPKPEVEEQATLEPETPQPQQELVASAEEGTKMSAGEANVEPTIPTPKVKRRSSKRKKKEA
jgi:ribosomal protein L31E